MTPRRLIPNAVPFLGGNEWKYVKECLDTNWVSSAGGFVDRFEREMAAYVGVPHAVATVNCSAALHVALRAAGVGRDDEVVLPTLTFIASAGAVATAAPIRSFSIPRWSRGASTRAGWRSSWTASVSCARGG